MLGYPKGHKGGIGMREKWNKIRCIEKLVSDEPRRAKDIDPVKEAYCRQCNGYNTRCKEYRIDET